MEAGGKRTTGIEGAVIPPSPENPAPWTVPWTTDGLAPKFSAAVVKGVIGGFAHQRSIVVNLLPHGPHAPLALIQQRLTACHQGFVSVNQG